ncbi:MAG TPA: hypothetical protein DEF06_05120 [Clostridiales bacterium]|nr:hypothetical protein [Clostridiales bacterium]
MKAVIYARFSSERQTEDSIAAQIRACREYAAGKGLLVIGEYIDEAISGKGSKTASRAQYQKLLRDSEKHLFDIILIHKYDRIARSLLEHVNLEQRLKNNNVELIATAQDFGNTNEAKIMRSLMWSLSEYYIDNLASEVQKGHREAALQGLHNGGSPLFGYDVVNQKYVINELEAIYVRKIFLAAYRRTGFSGIIAEMAARGITGKHGRPIQYTQIYEMLKNEKYTGVYLYSVEEEKSRKDRRTKPNAIRIENAVPVIIEKGLFQEVQKIMSERKHAGRKSEYLCSGLVYCSCGAKMHGIKSTRKEHTYHYFYCSKKCGASVVHMDEVDSAACEYLHTLLSDENQKLVADALRKYQETFSDRLKDFQLILKGKIHEKQKQYETLLKNMTVTELPAEVMKDMAQQLQDLKTEIEALKNTTPPADYTAEQIGAWLNSLKNAPDREAVRLLIEKIEVKGKTEFNISSTLNSVIGNTGCGGRT